MLCPVSGATASLPALVLPLQRVAPARPGCHPLPLAMNHCWLVCNAGPGVFAYKDDRHGMGCCSISPTIQTTRPAGPGGRGTHVHAACRLSCRVPQTSPQPRAAELQTETARVCKPDGHEAMWMDGDSLSAWAKPAAAAADRATCPVWTANAADPSLAFPQLLLSVQHHLGLRDKQAPVASAPTELLD